MAEKASNGVKAMIGTKGRMTQIFDEKGEAHAATIVMCTPLTVTQLKGADTDGYAAMQVGSTSLKESRVNQAQKGKPFRYFREFPVAEGAELGKNIDVSVFAV